MSIEVADPVLADVADRLGQAPKDPRLAWLERARPEQLLPAGIWRVTYWQGGRGSGKTASGAGALADWVLSDTDPSGEYGIVAPTYADAWTKCVEGEAGILQALGTSMSEIKDHRSATVRAAWRTYGQVILHSGITIYIDSASDGGLRIQGRNLKGAWADEIGLWERWDTTWNESLKYAVRKGRAQIIATGTPKASRPARKLVRSLIRNEPEHGGVIIRKLKTIDNAANLSDAFLRSVVGAAAGTRLERQELEGELLDDVANALWTRDTLERIQCPAEGEPGGPPYLSEIVIGVDPSDGSEASDEQAYTVAGLGPAENQRLYVTESWGGQMAPAPFARKVLLRAAELNAMIIVEKNHGGEWLRTVFEQVMRELEIRVRVRMVHASQAKRTRAEPVSAMYERDKIRHSGGPFVELEDQMATFTGAQGERSPDRLDSLVWAVTPFLKRTLGPPVGSAVQKWAGQGALEEAGRSKENRARRRLQQAHGGAYAGRDWNDLDSWAPRDDDHDGQSEPRSGAQVRSWY